MKSIFPVQELMGPVINLVSWIKPRGSNAEIYYFIYYSIQLNHFQEIVHSVELEWFFYNQVRVSSDILVIFYDYGL